VTVNRPIHVTPGSLFFTRNIPIHVNRVSESFQLQEHTHDFVEISIVAEGDGEHYIDNTHFKVSKGDLFYIPVGVSHVFRPLSVSSDRRLIVYNCIFTGACLDGIMNHLPLEPDIQTFFNELNEECRWIAVRDPNGEAGRILQRLYLEHAQQAPGYSTYLYTGLIDLLIFIYRRNYTRSTADSPSGGSGVRELLARIDHDCAQTIRAGEIAADMGISVRQLQRLIRDASGMSLTEYVQESRIKESCRLLNETSNKIGTIAVSVGYQDLKFFNRLFKQRTGMTPREYRKRSREASGQIP
jgi:AraC family transcriptional regulator, L-rhamnose operon transcriptional activator RhaR